MSPTLSDLEAPDAFQARHIGPDAQDRQHMLRAVGAASMDQLITETVPAGIRLSEGLALPEGCDEAAMLDRMRAIADRNRAVTSMIGMGYYGTHTPPVILRNVLENPGWYTAYTPYQPEISQGRLEALLTFQTMVADLTGLEIANASLLDEATAAAEAMTLARRVGRSKAEAFFVDANCHPQTIAVLRTRAEPLGIPVIVGDPVRDLDPAAVFAALFQYPGTDGAIPDLAAPIDRLHGDRALAIVATDLLALTVLKAPGEFGADIAVGSAQRFGVPMGYGGPHAAFIATRDAFRRSLPGRLVGLSVDRDGRPALRLALQTREQHIRRDKATSNICTAQVLLAVIAGLYACWHGPDGLTRIARRSHRLASLFADGLRHGGATPRHATFFDTVTIPCPGTADHRVARALAEGINIRRVDADAVAVSFDETSTRGTVEALWRAFEVDRPTLSVDRLDAEAAGDRLPDGLVRRSPFLTHPTFSNYRSETEMLRYLRRLADKDIALDRAMIPLGSCTMKLNAAAEMLPISWPAFARIHPFAPAEQAQGYKDLVDRLSRALEVITGYDAVSLQPNAGSQGEYAGLLAIRAYHRSRGDLDRTVCLIPESAHGTNPASAVMAGFRVVVVACDADGNVDVDDLKAKAAEHGAHLGALMVTYPSTHGVFEAAIGEICGIVHDHGGQVYVDGANLNALVGLAKPGKFGADVSHLNLHKTFCIPHGGGGPGVGPIGVRAHLAPFLPNHPLRSDAGPASGIGPVSAAPYGSAGILPISWAYIEMMGAEGLRRASEQAILSANYIAARLRPHYPVLYAGQNDRVAHEVILDTRPLKAEAGISVDDIAKRLIDYGFHAPTMSFPVPGTLMIEPTESEGLAEIDRFCEAMIAIRQEIARVAQGHWPADDNPLVNAPHTADDLLVDRWAHAYERSVAAYPVPGLKDRKYWPPVARVDQAYGDRHLVCSCPSIDGYREAAE